MTLSTGASTGENRPAERIAWLDTAKAYGIALVFYGHFVERMVDQGYATAFPFFKLVYAFHIPLFFILAGYVWRERQERFDSYLRYRLASRIVPVLFFNLVAFVVFAIRGSVTGTADWGIYLTSLLMFLRGYPAFNWVTWFLICLFTVELIHFWVRRVIRTPLALLASAALFLLAGWIVTAKIDWVVRVTGITQNFWFIHEALTAYAFYQLGILARQSGFLERLTLPGRLLIGVGSAAVLLATYGLNHGPFTGEKPVVLMAESAHGFTPLFALTAVAGALVISVLAQFTPSWRPVAWLGRNTVALLGLNGLLHNFVNLPVAGWLRPVVPDSAWAVLAASLLVTSLSLAACAPFAALANRYLPHWVGRPTRAPARD